MSSSLRRSASTRDADVEGGAVYDDDIDWTKVRAHPKVLAWHQAHVAPAAGGARPSSAAEAPKPLPRTATDMPGHARRGTTESTPAPAAWGCC